MLINSNGDVTFNINELLQRAYERGIYNLARELGNTPEVQQGVARLLMVMEPITEPTYEDND